MISGSITPFSKNTASDAASGLSGDACIDFVLFVYFLVGPVVTSMLCSSSSPSNSRRRCPRGPVPKVKGSTSTCRRPAVVLVTAFLVNDVKNLSLDGLFMVYLKGNNKITIYITPIINVGAIYYCDNIFL